MADQGDDDILRSWTPVSPISWSSIGPDLSPITFDPDGDLCLTVGPEDKNQEMQVDSRALRRASPVFRVMLRGDYADGQPVDGERNVRLPGDHVEGFAVLMDMIHIQSARTPLLPGIPLLYEIVRLADKYDMIRVLRPVATNWLTHHQNRLEQVWFDDCIRLLFIAQELGAPSLFQELTIYLAQEVYGDADGRLTDCHADRQAMPGTRSLELPVRSAEYLLSKFQSDGLRLTSLLTWWRNNEEAPASLFRHHQTGGSLLETRPALPTISSKETDLSQLDWYGALPTGGS